MAGIENLQKSLPHGKIRQTTSIQYRCYVLLVFLIVVACGNNRRPGVSDRELFTQRAVDTLQETKQVPDFSDMETYVAPPGVRYSENRAVDPPQPSVDIDIEKALQREAENIPLSSIGKSIKYTKVIIPKNTSVLDFVIRDDTLFVSCRDQIANQQFIVPYTLDGKFMNFIWEVTPKGITKKNYPDLEEEELLPPEPKMETNNRPPPPPPPMPPGSQGDEIIFDVNFDHTGKEIHYTITRQQDRNHPEYRKHIISRINGVQQAVYSERFEEGSIRTYFLPSIGWMRVCKTLDSRLKKSPWSLIIVSARGDTLCRFANHNPVTPVSISAGFTKEFINAYFYNDMFTFRTDYADTIFRVVAPDKILPVYAINSGKYKLLAVEGLRGQVENKVYIENIRETQDFLFISINSPARENHILLFDKQRQTLRLHRNESFANDIDNGPAFYPEKIMPDGKTMACKYMSSYFQNTPSTTISNLFPSMAKNNVIFMILL